MLELWSTFPTKSLYDNIIDKVLKYLQDEK